VRGDPQHQTENIAPDSTWIHKDIGQAAVSFNPSDYDFFDIHSRTTFNFKSALLSGQNMATTLEIKTCSSIIIKLLQISQSCTCSMICGFIVLKDISS
jgi:hypothetical protein